MNRNDKIDDIEVVDEREQSSSDEVNEVVIEEIKEEEGEEESDQIPSPTSTSSNHLFQPFSPHFMIVYSFSQRELLVLIVLLVFHN